MNKDTKFSSDKTMCFGKKLFSLSKPMVMGILNCTTDSFYDGGQYTSEEAISALSKIFFAEMFFEKK